MLVETKSDGAFRAGYGRQGIANGAMLPSCLRSPNTYPNCAILWSAVAMSQFHIYIRLMQIREKKNIIA